MDIKDAFLQVEQPADESYTAKFGRQRDLESMEEVRTLFRATVKVNGPFQLPGDMYEFLRRRHQFEPDGSITIGDMFDLDNTEAASRPSTGLCSDCQAAIQCLSGKASAPTERAAKLLQHLATTKEAQEEETTTSFSDSNFANVVTLSSGEAELVALTQTTSECILVKKAWCRESEAPSDLLLVDPTLGGTAPSQGASGPDGVQPRRPRDEVLHGKAAAPSMLCYLVGLVHDNGEHVGQNEFREATARRVAQGDRNNDVVVRLVQLLAATTLQGCEFGPAGPHELFEDLASLIYLVIVVVVRYFWFVGVLALAWWMGRRSTTSLPDGGHLAGRAEATEHSDQEDAEHNSQEATEHNNQEATINQEGPSGNTNNNHSQNENALPMLGITTGTGLEQAAASQSREARPTGATSSGGSSAAAAVALPVASSSSTRSAGKVEQARERGKFLRDVQHFLPDREFHEMVWVSSHGYAYHKEGCGDLKCAPRTSRMTVQRALQSGRVPCKHCFQYHWEYSRGER
ncbi:unnamed protein product [Symbiodinium sp. CCMP2592]|nr:unnamed protein product [Symbiodinium sp. CCMP2592]